MARKAGSVLTKGMSTGRIARIVVPSGADGDEGGRIHDGTERRVAYSALPPIQNVRTDAGALLFVGRRKLEERQSQHSFSGEHKYSVKQRAPGII